MWDLLANLQFSFRLIDLLDVGIVAFIVYRILLLIQRHARDADADGSRDSGDRVSSLRPRLSFSPLIGFFLISSIT